MEDFDMKRFGHVLKLDFAEGRKSIMWGTLCMTLLYLFFFWFAHNIGFHDIEPGLPGEPDSSYVLIQLICEAVGAFSLIAMFIFFLVAASILYRSEQKKQQRIAWLMLPATNLEKFLARWIYMVVFSLVGGMLSFFVADVIHMIWLWMSGNNVMATTPYFFHTMPHTDSHAPLLNIINVYGMMVTIHAFFLLGSVLFRKYHFIVSASLLFLTFIIMATLYNASGLYQYNGETARTITDDVFIVFEAVAISLFIWLAYRLFCRWQVVTHKFANV